MSYFPSHQVLPKKQATKTALSEAATKLEEVNYLHFSCHGSFNFNSPQNSFLLLADAYVSPVPADANPERYLKVSEDKALDLSKCLTLGNLFERDFDFSQTRLVVLSASRCGPLTLFDGHRRDLPVPAQGASAHARVSDHAGPVGHSRWRTRPCCLPPWVRRRRPGPNPFAAQWLAYAIPYRRFAAALTDDNARLGADVGRYSFIATDLHRLLIAGLPAHTH